MTFLLLVALSVAAAATAATNCESSPEARKALKSWRESWGKAPLTERRQQLDQLAAKFPAAMEIQDQRLSFYRWNLPDAFPAVREAAVRRAEANPEDPLALTLAATALHRTNTSRSIALLEKARQVSPDFPWAALKLADLHQSGKFEDKEKARASFETFARACGDRIPRSAEWLMGKVATAATQATVAKALRARLEKESDPDDLLAFESLWGLEFRTWPPLEHPALRKQVAADVERLARSNPKPDARWIAMLKNGAKQSGAAREILDAYDDRLLKEFPASDSAYSAAYERWKKDHKEPEDHADRAAWDAWKKDYLTAMKQWSAQFTEVDWLKRSYVETAIENGVMSEKEAVAALEENLRKQLRNASPDSWLYMNAAGPLLKKGWAPERTLDWMEKAWPLAEAEDRRELENDTLTEDRRKEMLDNRGYRGLVALRYLRALQLAGKKSVTASLQTFVEGPAPAKKSAETDYYWSRARLASIEQRNTDALAYFQSALLSRDKAPKPWRGVLRDELLDDAKAHFLKTGGSETAFALWTKPRELKTQELAEGRWEKPKKTLPPFELADLSGKIWKLKQLEGKSLLINLWATWCPPCRAELPHFQKLYEKTKDRSDVQAITFNIDEEFGLVEPFLKENNYSFPVLTAYGFVRELLDGIGIPQNWLVDTKGNWIWTQMGFDASDSDWVNSMMRRLEAAKEGR